MAAEPTVRAFNLALAGAPLAGVSSGLLLRLINACYGALLLNGVLWVGLPALRRLRLTRGSRSRPNAPGYALAAPAPAATRAGLI